MNAIKKLTGRNKLNPIEWDQRIKAIQAELQSIGDDLSEKRSAVDRAKAQLSNSERELEFYTVPPGRHETRVYPRNRKEDQARIEQDVRRGKVAVEFAEKAYRPLEEQNAALQAELDTLQANPPAVTKADLKKSYAVITDLEQKLDKIRAAQTKATNDADEQPINALRTELEQAKSAYELAASGVALGESTQADVQKAEQHLKQVRARIAEAEDAAAAQEAAVSGYGRRIESIEGELEQANDTHRILIGLFGRALQQAAVERINQAIDGIKAELGEIAQADRLLRRHRMDGQYVSGSIGLTLEHADYSRISGVTTGRLLPDDTEVRSGVNKLLVSIGYPIQPEDDEE